MSEKMIVAEIRPSRKKDKRVKIILWIPQEFVKDVMKVFSGKRTDAEILGG